MSFIDDIILLSKLVKIAPDWQFKEYFDIFKAKVCDDDTSRKIYLSLANLAIEYDSLYILKILVNDVIKTPSNDLLKSACEVDDPNPDIIQYLVDKKCDVNMSLDDDGGTLLKSLIYNNGKDKDLTNIEKCIDIFMRNGLSNINESNMWGVTALGRALGRKNYSIISKLIIHGAELHNKAKYSDFTPYEEIKRNDYKMYTVNVYLKKEKNKIIDVLSADVISASSMEMNNGKTMLPFPVSGGHIALFELIVEYMFQSKIE
jgi:hypothetical protein